MAQAWLFGLCAALCFMLGADALRCADCVLLNQEEKCERTCEARNVPNSGCIVDRTFIDGNFDRMWLGCHHDSALFRCDTNEVQEDATTYKPTRYEIKCCSDEDLCNLKL